MNKTQLYEVQFSAILTVAARSQRQAIDNAARLMDNPLAFCVNVRETTSYPAVIDPHTLDEPRPVEPEEKDESLPF